MKALVVMDSSLETLELCDELTRVGLYTQHAPSGLYALTMLERERPNLVVCGEDLGDMDGQELLGIVREDTSMNDVAFILLSGDAVEELENNLLLPKGTPIGEVAYRAELMLGMDHPTLDETAPVAEAGPVPEAAPSVQAEAAPVAAPVLEPVMAPVPEPVAQALPEPVVAPVAPPAVEPVAPPVLETPKPAPAPAAEAKPIVLPGGKLFDPNQSTANYEHVRALLEMVQQEAIANGHNPAAVAAMGAIAADALGAKKPSDLALPFDQAMATPAPAPEPEFEASDLEIDVSQLGELTVEDVPVAHSLELDMELLEQDATLDEPFGAEAAPVAAPVQVSSGDPWTDAPVTGSFEFAGRGFIRMVESMATVTEHGRLHLRCGPESGQLFFAGGRLVHAEFAGQSGEDGLRRAFLAAADHKGGNFALETLTADEAEQLPSTVHKPVNQILLTWSA